MNHFVIALFTIVILDPYIGLSYEVPNEYEIEIKERCIIVITEPNREICIGLYGVKYHIYWPTSDVETVDW